MMATMTVLTAKEIYMSMMGPRRIYACGEISSFLYAYALQPDRVENLLLSPHSSITLAHLPMGDLEAKRHTKRETNLAPLATPSNES